MAKLIYSSLASLDGYVADEKGNFDWAAPDEEVHTFVNDLERPAGTYLYGRRMYETMVFWETAPTAGADESPAMLDYARIWQAADKVVYSTTLDAVSSAKTRLERAFDPDVVRKMKTTAERDITVGGPDLAGQAIKAGLVDELRCSSFRSSSAAAIRHSRPMCDMPTRASRRTPIRIRGRVSALPGRALIDPA